MKPIIAIPLGTAALVSLVACGNPDIAEDTDSSTANAETGETVRERQLESDERAQQEREAMFNDTDENLGAAEQQAASDRELTDLIQATLDNQMPDHQLTVAAENGIITVTGDVASEAEWKEVVSLISATAGVQSVDMQVNVANLSR